MGRSLSIEVVANFVNNAATQQEEIGCHMAEKTATDLAKAFEHCVQMATIYVRYAARFYKDIPEHKRQEMVGQVLRCTNALSGAMPHCSTPCRHNPDDILRLSGLVGVE